MNFTPVNGGLMRYLNGRSNRQQSPKSDMSRIRERQKCFFDTLGNDWYCSLTEYESYIKSGEPSDLSVFKKASRPCLSPIPQNTDESELTDTELENRQNAHYDRLFKEYQDEHNYFSRYNDLSEAKELDYIVEDMEEVLSPRESDTLQQE